MNDLDIMQIPGVLEAVHRDSQQLGFAMASEPKTGSLLASRRRHLFC